MSDFLAASIISSVLNQKQLKTSVSSSYRTFYCLLLFQCVHDYECGTQVKQRKKDLWGKKLINYF